MVRELHELGVHVDRLVQIASSVVLVHRRPRHRLHGEVHVQKLTASSGPLSQNDGVVDLLLLRPEAVRGARGRPSALEVEHPWCGS